MKKINFFSIARRIERPLILDGAIGSYLQQKFPESNDVFSWMTKINTEHPEILFSLYKEYILSGADIITTNTFRTNPLALKNHTFAYNLNDLIKRTVDLAFLARGNASILVAGSNPPAEDCYSKERTVSFDELQNNHHKHIDLLMNSGVDFILNETLSHFDEINIICKYCSWNNIPYVLSLYITEDGKILSGESVEDVLNFVLQFKPYAIGFNCIKPQTMLKIVENYEMNFNWGTYLNCYTNPTNNCETPKDNSCITPLEYVEIIKKILPFKPSFVGACCGSKPEHIKQIRDLFRWTY